MDNKFKSVIKKSDLASYYLYARIANLFLLIIYKNSNITPNVVTAFSVILGIISGVSFAFGSPFFGIIFLNLSFILDCVDGQLAQLLNKQSEFGLWFDNTGDRLTETSVIIGLSLGFLSNPLVGYLMIAFTSLYWYASDMIYNRNRLLPDVKPENTPSPQILKPLNLLCSKGVMVLVLSFAFINVTFVFAVYVIAFLIKIIGLFYRELIIR
jgi:phosphatidylglycerophosphate synthase